MKARLLWASATALALLSACGKIPAASLSERWNWQNDPQHMDGQFVEKNRYEDHFSSLPLAGKLSKEPWTGDYWPTYRGGIAYRWNGRGSEALRRGYDLIRPWNLDSAVVRFLSPAEKYDLLRGRNDFPFTHAERERTRVLETIPGTKAFTPGFEIPHWEGLCHAWAVAALHYQEPHPVVATVQRGPNRGLRIPFASADIKALLTYFLHETPAETSFLGERCDSDLNQLEKDHRQGKISEEDYQQQRRACSDTNAGAFHLVLANQLGLLDEGFIFDVTREAEVWNHPVYEYASEILEEHAGASPGAAPGTAREVYVKTLVKYTVELGNRWNQMHEDALDEREYSYRLELDAKGAIIGGAWPDDGADRPDFLWKSTFPDFKGVFSLLGFLYEQSIR